MARPGHACFQFFPDRRRHKEIGGERAAHPRARVVERERGHRFGGLDWQAGWQRDPTRMPVRLPAIVVARFRAGAVLGGGEVVARELDDEAEFALAE